MLLMIQTYPGGNETFERNWPFFLRSGAHEIWAITTEGGGCWVPEDVPEVRIGKNCYINGSHLPTRLVDTLEVALSNKTSFDHILVAEYDTLILSPIRYRAMEHAVASHRAGSSTWGSKVNSFYHNPWLFKREAAKRFVDEGRTVIAEGIPDRQRGQPPPPEASPDVFFGFVMERMKQPVQIDLWSQYSRNSLDIPGHLEEARQARKNGVDVIHGAKTKIEHDYIFS